MKTNSTTTKILAPEDIHDGQFVSLLDEIGEHISCFFPSDATLDGPAPRRVRWLPDEGELPMRVIAVCLPFVLVERADGQNRVLDVRHHRLTLITDRFGRKAFKRFRPKRPKSSRRRTRE